jgi:hypothetical protein
VAANDVYVILNVECPVLDCKWILKWLHNWSLRSGCA